MTTTVTGLAEIKPLAGRDLGSSSWVEVGQDRIDAFAHATGDHQWIHVDPDRAQESPFGGTIAHGRLTLALLTPMWNDLLDVQGAEMAVDHGLNRVRFPAPVPSGSRIRLGATLMEVSDVPGGVQVLADLVVRCDRADRPVCVAEAVYRYYD